MCLLLWKAAPGPECGKGPANLPVGPQRLFGQQCVGGKKVFHVFLLWMREAAALPVTDRGGERVCLKHCEKAALVSPGGGPNHQPSDQLHGFSL